MALLNRSDCRSVWRTGTQYGLSCEAVRAFECLPQPIHVGVLNLRPHSSLFHKIWRSCSLEEIGKCYSCVCVRDGEPAIRGNGGCHESDFGEVSDPRRFR